MCMATWAYTVAALRSSGHRAHHTPLPLLPQVILYDGQTKEVARTISRFKDCAFSGTFRSDGKLVVAGSQDGMVQVRALRVGWLGLWPLNPCGRSRLQVHLSRAGTGRGRGVVMCCTCMPPCEAKAPHASY